MNDKTIGVFVGSMRRASYSKQIARCLADMMPEGWNVRFIRIDDLPLFNQDFEEDGTTPQAYTRYREEVKALDAFLFVTPEYNRSVPAVLKNALDVGSRPYGQNCFDGKPAAIVSVSPGRTGGFGANHHLRQVMVFLNIYVMQQPEAYVGGVDAMLAEDGTLKDAKSRDYLQNIAGAFADWVRRF